MLATHRQPMLEPVNGSSATQFGAKSTVLSHQSVFVRAPTLREWLLFPTAPLWAIVIALLNFDACSAIPHLTLFSIISSAIVEVDDVVRWIYRVPFFPHLRRRCLPTLCSAALEAVNVCLVSWGGYLTYADVSRLAHNGGENCAMPAYLTGFLCSLIPALLYLAMLSRAAVYVCSKKAPAVDPLLHPTP